MRKLSMSLGKTEDAEKKEWGYDQQGPPPLRLWTLPGRMASLWLVLPWHSAQGPCLDG